MLHLKVGAYVTLMRNISPRDGLVNGTPLVVRHITNRFVFCTKTTDAPGSPTIPIPRISFAFDVPKFNLCIQRRQFPLRVGY